MFLGLQSTRTLNSAGAAALVVVVAPSTPLAALRGSGARPPSDAPNSAENEADACENSAQGTDDQHLSGERGDGPPRDAPAAVALLIGFSAGRRSRPAR